MPCIKCGSEPCKCQWDIYRYETSELNRDCDTCEEEYTCRFQFPGHCVFYTGENLTCLLLTSNINYDLIVSTIHAVICQLQECCNQCVAIELPEPIPDLDFVVGEESTQSFPIVQGSGVSLAVIAQAVWVDTVVYEDGYIKVTGTPDVAGSVDLSITLSNSCSFTTVNINLNASNP